MRAKKIGKLCVDITMLAVSVLLMAAERTGIGPHMLLGAGMLVLALIHNLLNLPWWRSLGKGRYDRPRRLRTAVNLLLLADLLAALVSGISKCYANVELALTIGGVPKAERRTRAQKALEEVGLGGQDSSPTERGPGIYAGYGDLERSEAMAGNIKENDLTAFKRCQDDPDSGIRPYLGENGAVYGYDVRFGVYSRGSGGTLVASDADVDEAGIAHTRRGSRPG